MGKTKTEDLKEQKRRKRIRLVPPGPYHRTPAKRKETQPEPLTVKPSPEDAPAEKTVPIRKVKPWTQCFKCQLWGHLSYDCKNDSRCLKCGNGHRASECTKPSDEVPTCANCQEHHTSNYRGCKAAPKRKRARRPRRKLHKIPGLPIGTVGKLIRTIAKLLTRENFFSEEQMAIIAEEMNDVTAPMESQAPPTSVPVLVPRCVQLHQPIEIEKPTPTPILSSMSADELEEYAFPGGFEDQQKEVVFNLPEDLKNLFKKLLPHKKCLFFINLRSEKYSLEELAAKFSTPECFSVP